MSAAPPGLPPLPLRQEIAVGIHGALLLARGRPEGVLLASPAGAGAWRSSVVALICLPAMMAMTFFGWAQDGWPAQGVGRALGVELLRYVIGWAAFLLMSEPLAAMAGRSGLWPRFVSAWNWSQVPQYLALILTLMLPARLGLPPVILQALGLVGIGYAIWLEWYVTRWALQVSRPAAAAFVVADLALTILISRLFAAFGG